MNFWVWSRSVDFSLGFSWKIFDFYILHCQNFWPRIFWSQSNLLEVCCDCTLIRLVLKTNVLIFNTSHKTGCFKCWYCFRWYNLWRAKSGSFNYPIHSFNYSVHCRYYKTYLFFKERCTYSNFCVIIFFYFLFCFLNFTFDIYIMWFLSSNKTWLCESFCF